MKVLIVSCFPPDPAPEANHAVHLAEQLTKLGIETHVLCKQGSRAPRDSGIILHPVIRNWSWSDSSRLTKVLKEVRPDVVLLVYIGWVFSHQSMITFLPTICKRVLPGVPCVTQFENVDEFLPVRRWPRGTRRALSALRAGNKGVHPLLGTLLRDSARLIALSSPHRERLVKQDRSVFEKTAIVPPSPLIRFCSEDPGTVRNEVRVGLGVDPQDFVLVCWGFIYPGKGLETLLQAFRIVCTRHPGTSLIVAGGTLDFPTEPISCADYYGKVRRLPETLGITAKVKWTGPFEADGDEGSRYLHAADVCVLPFDYGVTLNNSSLAAATTHHLPVIGTELLDGRDEALEHGRNIYLCPPSDVEALAEAIENVRDCAKVRRRLQQGAEDLAAEWHRWDATARRVHEVLKSAVAAGTSDKKGSEAVDKLRTARRIQAWGNDYSLSQLVRSPQSTGAAIARPDPPLVSIVLAVHNVGKYLPQCLDALVHQTLENVEIVAINDASTDDSLEILEAYRAEYPQLRVIDLHSNVGLASVRNVGLREARGRYVGFADGDDWVDTRMCEVMYRKISADCADVLLADTQVFYDDQKTFGQFFDLLTRQSLDPRIKTRPFELRDDTRVLLLEPVAWTKLYDRSFLEKHGLEFEGGLNSYEDMCFHFAVLLKARRLSLIDDTLMFYRQNRPGQISGRTSREVFEVFDVIDRIHQSLVESDPLPEVWGRAVRIYLRQFDWLLGSRVQQNHKREFIDAVAQRLSKVPTSGFEEFAREAKPFDLAKLHCLRRGRLRTFERLTTRRWAASALAHVLTRYPGRRFHEKGLREVRGKLRQKVGREKSSSTTGTPMLRSDEELFEVCKIGTHEFFVTSPSGDPTLANSVRRMKRDYYLTQTAVLRKGDVVVDIGAHCGVLSIYLAKHHPYIRVVAVEPDPLAYRCLVRNIELNGLPNVVAQNSAICGEPGVRTLYSDARDSGMATINRDLAGSMSELRAVQVDGTTLDQLFEQHAIERCRLLKISAPGAIREALDGLTAGRCVDLLCGEAALEDCSRGQLEMASWRIARQHFWRTRSVKGDAKVQSWLHRIPEAIEEDRATATNVKRLPRRSRSEYRGLDGSGSTPGSGS